ncbi:hypothetical protein DSO57_1005584 [Entomophthora muscae]|nr:hypothetical protein DSO57_1005584 [Entomophthora muscae]
MYELVPRPVGPHPIGMFELLLRTPDEFAKFVPWFLINRDSHVALLHPNTPNGLEDHSTHAMWFGDKLPLSLGIFDRFKQT